MTDMKNVDLSSVQQYIKDAQKYVQYVQWDRCPVTGKPEVCPANLWRIRAAVGVGAFAAGYLASYAFLLYGFGDGGVVSGSLATSWQSSIGNVVAGSPFAILQTMGAKGTGVLLCGGVGMGLGTLAGLAVAKKIDWCTCQYDSGKYIESKL